MKCSLLPFLHLSHGPKSSPSPSFCSASSQAGLQTVVPILLFLELSCGHHLFVGILTHLFSQRVWNCQMVWDSGSVVQDSGPIYLHNTYGVSEPFLSSLGSRQLGAAGRKPLYPTKSVALSSHLLKNSCQKMRHLYFSPPTSSTDGGGEESWGWLPKLWVYIPVLRLNLKKQNAM